MRLGRIVLVALGMSAAFAEPVKRHASDWDSIKWREPVKGKSKPNKISQAKRRKYKRQGRL
ncbi:MULTISPECIES: hypothetical protein [Acinetobacter]|uniref:hypothetical protein n=1 Tax=Acinetobacter TaxID=469 RepID=UPI0002CFB4BE|nr:hypothetical protein [Acinetobacter guillouiae]ENU57348.1 hypothetical protein F981_03576 [Acinetobacter guillouiae CIP 63.46]EPH30815.1 hypothetical protein L291_3974 [Acinetobacter guillouiae MSP4-18]KAB0624918.1 hypothetical protein F7P82_16975 [Acinetobacter guillouiae]